MNPGDAQWLIGKFAYGITDKDLKDEEVDVWLLRDCGTLWEKLGTALTTEESAHSAEEGVGDSGGRVYFEVPGAQALGQGRHRVLFVVGGDLTTTEAYVEVLEPGTSVLVTDVDGTLTTFETEEFAALFAGTLPTAQPDAAAALTALAEKGRRPFYLTARPEFLVQRTREFLAAQGFPAGIVHTTLDLTGALGAAAVSFKQAELDALAARSLALDWGFGNTASDADAYASASIEPASERVFVQFDDTAHGGRRIEAWSELLPDFADLEPSCP